jgi:hypothetical protein
LEKDLTGMWAMQSQMSGQPSPPDATDEQLKDAVWIVLMFPLSGGGPGTPPPDFKKVADHINAGGAALLMFAPQTDNFESSLKDWGIQVKSELIAAHEPVKQSEGRQSEALEDAQRIPFIFDIQDYGDHLITRPLRSLSGFFVPLEVVKTPGATDVKVTPILPIPENPKSWGESTLSDLDSGKAVFEPEKGDIPGPLYGGAVAEKKNGGRLVVIGCPTFAFDQRITVPDPVLLRQNRLVARFPANAELFANSVFWLAKMEPMIAISPAAMEVSRIEPMSDGALKAWRVGALLIGLPGLVILAGAMVYVARRD